MTTLGTVGDYQVGLWIEELVAVHHFMSLHFADPRVSSPTAVEVTDADYSRQQFDFIATGARTIALEDPITWENVDPIEISHIGVCAGPTGDDLRFVIVPPSPISVAAGHNYQLASGEFYVRW